MQTASGAYRPLNRERAVNRILLTVCAYYNAPMPRVTGRCREGSAALPRQVAMYLIREFVCIPFIEIGRQFGRDHTTVIHACRSIEARMDTDALLRSQVHFLSQDVERLLEIIPTDDELIENLVGCA